MRRVRGAFFACCVGVAAQMAVGQSGDRVEGLLERLSNAAGPPGAEEPVRAIMVGEMKPLATAAIRYDGTGSVIAQQGTTGPRIMIDAHMDELGGMVRRVTPNGFLSMQMLGGWLDQALVDQRWVIIGSKGPVHAVTGIRDIHVITPEERTKVFPRESVFLDVGAKNAAEVAAMGVEPGDPVVPDSPFMVMNGTKNYLGKGGMTGLDVRCCWRLCEGRLRCRMRTSCFMLRRRRRRLDCVGRGRRRRR